MFYLIFYVLEITYKGLRINSLKMNNAIAVWRESGILNQNKIYHCIPLLLKIKRNY